MPLGGECRRGWRQANEIRSYLAALRAKIESGAVHPDHPDVFGKWLDSADWYSNFLDPLTPTPDRPDVLPAPTNLPIDQLDVTRETRAVLPHLGVQDTNELHALGRDQVCKVTQNDWSIWEEICRLLEGLGYDVSGRKRTYY